MAARAATVQLTELGRRYLSWGESARRRFDGVAAHGSEEAGTGLIRVAVLGANPPPPPQCERS
ncbi:hypothetical protein [Nocardiopsis sp. JB363]|uniref:hypothetical protein n=1 Tax=Nocardiopsis sp. JB363 TaxID=1434837 RepID=UPI00097B5FD2|nr:hypothetical protein [Nocardiopsis sp. JB363]SIO86477.1 hypothetical protein BQ8420_12200 [Nocardiopsis sp. JB363]